MSKSKGAQSSLPIRFKAHQRVGAADAEHDTLLSSAFIDNGELSVIRQTKDPRCVLVGRTGSGKTALLSRLTEVEGTQECIVIDPTALSMRYLSNSTILPQLTEAGIHLDVFFKLLWRHVFLVELIKARFGGTKSGREGRITRWLDDLLRRDPKRRKALEYMEKFGGTFWEDSEEIVRKVVQALDGRLKASGGLPNVGTISAEAGGQVEVTKEVRSRLQAVVNDVQLQRLRDSLDIIKDEILDDEGRRFYLLVDDLDRNWVDEEFAYDMITALLEEAGELARLSNIKVVVAIREDILQRIYAENLRKRGAQREKYETLCLRIRWTPLALQRMIDERLRELLKDVRGAIPSMKVILPNARKNGGRREAPAEYLLERTMNRPRDLIHFVNDCITEAAGKSRIGWKEIARAEAKYSSDRLQSLEDEWKDLYPQIGTALRLLKGKETPLRLGGLDADTVIGLVMSGRLAESHEVDWDNPVQELAAILFKVGVLGWKPSPTDPVTYAYEDPHLPWQEVGPDTALHVHPMVWRALSIRSAR